MTFLVALDHWEVELWTERFRSALPGRRVVALGDAFDPAEIRYAASWKHPPGALAGMPGLRAIFSLGAGVDHLFADPHVPPVPIARVVDPDLTNRMSEYVLLHCLAHLRQSRRYEAQQRERAWADDRDQPAAREVGVGVMGMGELGRDAARKLGLVGFDVAGWARTRRLGAPPGAPLFVGEAERPAFLARSDILVVLLPLTPDTRGVIDLALLRGLRRDGRLGGPVLVNAGRGGLQVAGDILAALEEGSLGAAVLDVFEREPLPPDSPMWSHPRVTVTPHNAALSAPEAVGRLIAEQVARMERGEAPLGLVDRSRGY